MNRFFNIAKKVAEESPCQLKGRPWRHGAVLVKGGSVVSTGYNEIRRHSFASKFGYWSPEALHAELACVLGVDKSKTQGSKLYVVRIMGDGTLGMSKPCKHCQKALEYVGISRVYYSDKNGQMKRMKLGG